MGGGKRKDFNYFMARSSQGKSNKKSDISRALDKNTTSPACGGQISVHKPIFL
jgi:hypothetical protein